VHGVVAVRAVARAQVQVLQLGAEVVGTESVIGIRARYRGCGRGPPQRLRNLVRHIRGEHEDRGRRRELHGARLAAASRRHRQCGRPRDSKKYCRRTRLAEDRQIGSTRKTKRKLPLRSRAERFLTGAPSLGEGA
jgi:hypothetical protein